MGRGEGPVQRRHRRQLCERVQYVLERVSGKSVRRRVPGGKGRGGREGGPGRPPAARLSPVTRGSLLPASSLRGSSSPGGQLPVPSPAATQLPPPPTAPSAVLRSRDSSRAPRGRSREPAGGMGGSGARARVPAPAQ